MIARREFLSLSTKGSLLLSLAPGVPWLLLRSTARGAEARRRDRVLVVLQLSGGNDGLNSVVPFQDDAYARLRPTLRLKPGELHKLNPELGLHPRMSGFYRLFQEGRLAVVQGVGCPDQNRDHERAMRAWQTAVPEPDGIDTGWLGRATDHLWKTSQPAPAGVYVGSITQPLAINAAKAIVPSIRGGREALLFGAGADASRGVAGEGSATLAKSEGSSLLRHIKLTMEQGRNANSRLEALSESVSARANYPEFGLAQDLRTIANLIRAEVGIRIFYVELGGGGIGGFDNHANQIGNHCALLEQLSESVVAFAADLSRDRLFDRVLLMTFSEFGRTAAENGRRGTDHGVAGPVFLAGGSLRGGIHGAHPSLTDLDAGALKHHTDFRSVYATLLQDWLQIPPEPILGSRFPRLQLVS